MTFFTDFLSQNYFWFLVFSIMLFFSLIGYFVDQSDQKKGISKLVHAETGHTEADLEELAKKAAQSNKTLNNVITDAARKDMPKEIKPEALSNASIQNTIMDNTGATNTNTGAQAGFQVLTK